MSSNQPASPAGAAPRALVSVYDKTGVVELARRLTGMGWEIISSGGTASALADAGIPVVPVEQVTGAPEMMGGRVKTIHPLIHGALLADTSNPDHRQDLADRGIVPIDLVVCNLYPFDSDPSVELIDIGGPAMVRAAAKNHERVGVVVRPDDYEAVLAELESGGGLAEATRKRLAHAAFAHTSAYDAAIAGWLAGDDPEPLPAVVPVTLERAEVLRYGENPHQAGARYRIAGQSSWWDQAEQLQGKAMSYLNVFDADAAWRLAHSVGDRPAAVVIKHANPCGVAVADDVAEAYRRALDCDPVSAFGGVVAVNRPVTMEMAEVMADVFTEVLVASEYEPEALAVLGGKKNLRVLQAPPPEGAELEIRTLGGAALVQTPDAVSVHRSAWRVVTERVPTDDQWEDMELAWRVAARVGSNCIVLVKDLQAVGIGAGQQNRRDAGRIAGEKANGRATGGACASDAFFPFRDGLDAAAEAGCAVVIQPGGSVRDQEVIDAANQHNMAMVFTGQRHFRH